MGDPVARSLISMALSGLAVSTTQRWWCCVAVALDQMPVRRQYIYIYIYSIGTNGTIVAPKDEKLWNK